MVYSLLKKENMADKKKKKKDEEQQFPRSIEGPRGDKDSAFESKKFFEEQREFGTDQPEKEENDSNNQENLPNMENDNLEMEKNANLPPLDDDQIEGNFGSLGESIEERGEFDGFDLPPGIVLDEPDMEENAAVRSLSNLPGDETTFLAPTSTQTIDITNVRTSSQHGNTSTFLRTWDALTLVINISASQALVNSGRKFDANYQIIDYDTNTVVKNHWRRNTPFSWGTNFWISQGNNWGPERDNYTTPEKWGLGTGLYIFRATVQVQGTGAFSYSKDQVFRVR